MLCRLGKPLERPLDASKGTRLGDLSAQGARARPSCKILTVLWSGKMHMISDNVTDRILLQPVLVNVKKKLQEFGELWDISRSPCLILLKLPILCIT